jgi:hypothetical protein
MLHREGDRHTNGEEILFHFQSPFQFPSTECPFVEDEVEGGIEDRAERTRPCRGSRIHRHYDVCKLTAICLGLFLSIGLLLKSTFPCVPFTAYRPQQNAICKIYGFHGSDYEECCLLGCSAVWLL